MRKILIGSAIAAAMLSQQTLAAGTTAATEISNTATASFEVYGFGRTSTSDTSTFYVDEILDVSSIDNTIADTSVSTPTTGSPAETHVATYTIQNTGNGEETFDISVTDSLGSGVTWAATSTIYVEKSGSGSSSFDLADTLIGSSGTLSNLAADESVTVYVVTQIPAGLSDGDDNTITLNISSDSITVSDATHIAGKNLGAVGTSKPAPVTGNVDAIIGESGAQSSDTYVLLVSDIKVKDGSFLKTVKSTQITIDGTIYPDLKVPGAEVTYQISFELEGSATAANFVISDELPSEMNYVAGSVSVTGSVPYAHSVSTSTVKDIDNNDTTKVSISFVTIGASTQTVELKATIK